MRSIKAHVARISDSGEISNTDLGTPTEDLARIGFRAKSPSAPRGAIAGIKKPSFVRVCSDYLVPSAAGTHERASMVGSGNGNGGDWDCGIAGTGSGAGIGRAGV